jgi:hypothetical protein
MATIRQRLTDLVTARVAAVPGLTGAFVWRVTPLAQEELPAAIVRDRLCVSRIAATQVHEHRLTFEVDIFAPDVVSLRELLGLVFAALGQDVRWRDGGGQALAVNTEPQNDTLMTGQEERFLAGARLQFVIMFRTPSFDPTSVYP